jgi:IS30 family transposase
MAQIRTVDLSAKNRLKQRTKGYQEREPYRQAVLSLTSDSTIEIEPDEGETVRKIKLNLARASKEVSREVRYGETHDGTFVAWLAEADGAPRRRRGRPRKGAE